jgi:RecA/RadA recombinase
MAAAKKTTAKKTTTKKKAAAKAASKAPKAKAPKKQKKKELTKAEKLAHLKNSVNSQYKGRVIVQSGDEFSNVFLLRRPTGITSLDVAIGGGFPAGGLSQIIGSDGVGKDYLVNRTLSNHQAIYGEDATIALAMTELSYDKKYAKLCGVNIALTDTEIEEYEESIHRKFTPEERQWAKSQTGHIEQIMAATAEELLETTAQYIQSGLYHIVVINSFGALLTKAEAEADEGLAQKHYGGAAMPVTNFMHRVHAALNMPDEQGNPNRTTILGINQFRENLGKDAQWNPLKIAGGNALKHGKLVDIFLQQKSRIRIPGRTSSSGKITVGKEIHWEIIKGKVGCHDGPKGMYPFHFGEHGYPFGADVYEDLIMVGVQQGIIQMAGAWLSYQENGFDLRGQGKGNFSHAIANTPGAWDHLRRRCFDTAEVNFITKESNG